VEFDNSTHGRGMGRRRESQGDGKRGGRVGG